MKKRANKYQKKHHGIRNVIFLIFSILLITLIVYGISAVLNRGEASGSNSKVPQTSSRSNSNRKTSSSGQSETTGPTQKWLQSKTDNELPILMFHYASSQAADLAGGSNWMPDSTLEADLLALKNAGYTTVTSEQAIKIMTSHTKPSNKMVWLTFDDGSLTLYRDVFPLLKKYNMHATGAIITGFVDNHQSGILTWEQIKEMKASGLVDFISHTVSHLDLGTLSTADATYQLQQSKKELDSELGQDTNIICYPAGGYNQETIQIAKNLGYSYGIIDPGRNGAVAKEATASDGLMTLPRFRMASTTGPSLMMSYVSPATTFNEQNTVK